MKVSAKGYLYATQYSWQNEPAFSFHSIKFEDTETCVFVREFDVVDIEVPEDFNPTAQKIAALEAEKAQALADFAKSVAKIDDRIKKLQAIEFTA